MKTGSSVYLAGPMRGKPLFNFEEFFFWSKLLTESGYEVLNPAAFDLERMLKDGWRFSEDNYEEVLEFDLKVIEACADALLMLYGWEESEGANREHDKALELDLPTFYAKNVKIGTIIRLGEM